MGNKDERLRNETDAKPVRRVRVGLNTSEKSIAERARDHARRNPKAMERLRKS
jgi:hypothetical protein